MPSDLSPEKIEVTQSELIQLYQLYRISSLNVRYYGYRAAKTNGLNTRLRILSALGSSATIAGLIGHFSIAVLLVSAVTGLAATISPFLGLIDKTIKLEKLHFSYSQLFSRIDVLIREIRLQGYVDDTQVAVAAEIRAVYGALNALDETNPDRALIERFTSEVNAAIPTESLWLPSLG